MRPLGHADSRIAVAGVTVIALVCFALGDRTVAGTIAVCAGGPALVIMIYQMILQMAVENVLIPPL